MSRDEHLVPDGWQLRQLSQLADTFAGGTPNRNNPSFFGGDVPCGSSRRRSIYVKSVTQAKN